MSSPSPWGAEFIVSTRTSPFTFDFRQDPAITALANGRFVVTWRENWTLETETEPASDDDVRAQVFGADGTPVSGEFLVSTSPVAPQIEPAITALADGRFVVTWADESLTLGDASARAVHAQVFNPDGSRSGVEFLVNLTTASGQGAPTITALADGRFVAAWTDRSQSATSGKDVRAQVFNSDGSRSGDEFLVNTLSADRLVEDDPAIKLLADGRFVVAWSVLPDSNETGGPLIYEVRAQVFNADGTRSGAELLVGASTAANELDPAITALADGRFVVAWWGWTVRDDGSSSDSDVRFQVYNPDGSVSGGEVQVGATVASEQYGPSLAKLADGRFVVAWEDQTDNDVHAQVFNADGTLSGDEFLVNTTTEGSQGAPSISVLADGRFVVAWEDSSVGNGATYGSNMRAQIFDPRLGAVVLDGTGLDDEFVGTAFGDALGGGLGKDKLWGGAGDDTLDGGAGLDRLEGGAGDDTYVVDSAGDQVIEGAGAGADTVRASVSYTLGEPIETLVLTGAAALDGTGNSLANVLLGNGAANVLSGLGGTDTLRGGGGKDRLTGGTGSDEFVFLSRAEGGDTITDFQNKAGNNDRFVLDASAFRGGLDTGRLDRDQFQRGDGHDAQDRDIRVLFDTRNETLWFDRNGSKAGGLTLIADLQASAVLTHHDIWLV